MKGWVKSTLVLGTILLLTTTFFALLYRPPDPQGVPEAPPVFFELRISSSGVEPAIIQVAQGSLVMLNVTAVDENHNLGLPTFGISLWIPANETRQVQLHANLVGTYTYRCLIPAPGHVDEEGTLIVLPQA